MNLKSSFLKSISILTAGSAVSMLFLVIMHTVCPYIFSPEDMGIKSVILAVPMAVGSVVCGRYDLTLVYEPDDSSIDALLKLNILLNIVLSTLFTVVTLVYLVVFERDCLRYWYTVPAIWVYLVSYGLTLTLNSYNNRLRDYTTIAKMHAIRTAYQCLGTVIPGLLFVYLLGMNSLSVAILVIPYCLGMSAGIRYQGKSLYERRAEIMGTADASVRSIARKHIRQPLLSAPAIFANSFSYSLITIMMSYLYGKSVTGYYSLSVTLLGLPITLISGNISKVFMKDASVEFVASGSFKNAFKRNFLFLFALSVPMFIAMYYVVPHVTVILFGQKWKPAGDYIRILSVMFALRFITTALSTGLYICKKQSTELLLQFTFLFVTLFAGIVALRYELTPEGYLKALVIARSVVMVAMTIVVGRYAAGKGILHSSE